MYSATPADPDAPAPITKAAKAATTGDGITLLQSLLSTIASRSAPRRALFANLPFEVGPGLKISIKGFIIFKRQEPARTTYVHTDGEKVQLAVGTSTLMADDTARAVEKAEIRKAYKFGGETVSFSKEEMSQIRNFGDPVLRIVGFKPISMLPVWANTRPSTFIYPSEEEVIGSTRVFSALQQKLLSSDKMGVAWFVPRKNATPVLTAILPGKERHDDDNNNQTMPPGLWIHPIPFADDVREPPETSLVTAPDSLVDIMRTVIQQLQLPKGVYDPKRYPNPSLQWFYKILQALALEEDMPEKAEDKTIPRYRQIDKRAGPHVLEWGQELEQQFRAWQKAHASSGTPTASGATKRGAGGSKGDAAKKSRTESGAVPASTGDVPTDEEMRQLFEKNHIGKLTVSKLKAFAQVKGIGLKGATKKEAIVDEVTSWFENKMSIG